MDPKTQVSVYVDSHSLIFCAIGCHIAHMARVVEKYSTIFVESGGLPDHESDEMIESTLKKIRAVPLGPLSIPPETEEEGMGDDDDMVMPRTPDLPQQQQEDGSFLQLTWPPPTTSARPPVRTQSLP